MDILVLCAAGRSLRAVGYVAGRREAVFSRVVGDGRFSEGEVARCDRGLRGLFGGFRRSAGRPPAALALYVPFVADAVGTPCVATNAALAALEQHADEAPLHSPHAAVLLRRWRNLYPEIPQALLTGSDFFADLPEREACYGLDPEVATPMGLRRRGFHGLFHRAASRLAARREGRGARVLSVCLEPRPEVAALRGGRPMMVTGGATPLEGLPGETTCGDLDPGVVVALARDLGWGPERIHVVLTRESGLLGLAGRPTTVVQALNGREPAHRFAGEVLRYRLLLACGAGMAALGAVDALVFSGRYVDSADALGPWLAERLTFPGGPGGPDGSRLAPRWICLRDPLDRLIADEAAVLLRTAAAAQSSGGDAAGGSPIRSSPARCAPGVSA